MKSLSITHKSAILLVPAFMLTGLICISKFILMQSKDPQLLATAISIDFIAIIPFAYFLLIRKTQISKLTIIPLSIVGLIVGYTVLPEQFHNGLDFYKHFVLPLIELSILGFVGYKTWKFIRTIKNQSDKQHDFYSAFSLAAMQNFPKVVAKILTMEVGMLYFSLFKWKKSTPNPNQFTYHKNGNSYGLAFAIIFIVTIETSVLHILLHMWSPAVAWIASAISVYTGLQVLAIERSGAHRFIEFTNESLIIRYGLANEAVIPFHQIKKVEQSKRELNKDNKLEKHFSPFGQLSAEHNFYITTKEPVDFYGIYGIKSQFTSLALFADDKEGFQKMADKNIDTHDNE